MENPYNISSHADPMIISGWNFDFSSSAASAQEDIIVAKYIKQIPLGNNSDVIMAKKIIREISLLNDDWDGYGASSVGSEAVDTALNFSEISFPTTSLPEIFANPNGTITFEWESSLGLANLEIGKTRYSFYIDKKGLFIPASGPIKSLPSLVLIELINNELFNEAKRSSTVTISSKFTFHDDRIAA